jgi:formate hydrogenlyase subunit 4
MVILIFILLTATSGAYFTGIGCRRSLAQHRRPGWHLTLLGICITTLLTALFLGQGDLFQPSKWDSGKVGMLPIIIAILTAAVIALIASVIVVSIFRGIFRDENDVV